MRAPLRSPPWPTSLAGSLALVLGALVGLSLDHLRRCWRTHRSTIR